MVCVDNALCETSQTAVCLVVHRHHLVAEAVQRQSYSPCIPGQYYIPSHTHKQCTL